MGNQIPNNSSKNTSGRLPRNLTWRAYAAGPPIAEALEIRMCSNRNAPTGMIPVSECSRRKTNEIPWPARRGATPGFTDIGAELALAATDDAPYEFNECKRTLHYLFSGEGKSRKGERGDVIFGGAFVGAAVVQAEAGVSDCGGQSRATKSSLYDCNL